MLALKAPYGYPRGVGLSLMAIGPIDRKAVAIAVSELGCPYFICKNVAECLYHSGRYDTRIMDGVARAINLRESLALVNGSVETDVVFKSTKMHYSKTYSECFGEIDPKLKLSEYEIT